jgi:hypothetical protein
MTGEERGAWQREARAYHAALDQSNHERAKRAAATREHRDREHRELTEVYGRDVIALINRQFGPEVRTSVIEGGTFRPFGYITNFRVGNRHSTSDAYKWGSVILDFRYGSEERAVERALGMRDWLKEQGITATPTGDGNGHGLYVRHPRKNELPVWTTSLEVSLGQIAEKAGTY